MSKTFHVTIAKIGENLYNASAVSVTLPGVEGAFEVLADHEPLVARLKSGQARIVKEDGTKVEVEIPGNGIAEVSHNQATVLL